MSDPRIRWWRHASFMAGVTIVTAVIALALIARVWTPYDPLKLAIPERLQGLSARHWLGTDHLGHDALSMLMRGAGNVLAVSFVAVGAGMVIGLALGLVAAARHGTLIDDIISRLGDFTVAFPAVLTAIMIAALAGPGPVNTVIAVAVFNIPWFAKLGRAAALGAWSRDYVRAARAMGLDLWTITRRHIAPNIAGLVIVQATTQFALAILAEAGLSYLGLGAQPPEPSWGRMLFDAQTYIQQAPRLAIVPGIAIAVTVLGFNLMGDGLRDLIDPRHRRKF